MFGGNFLLKFITDTHTHTHTHAHASYSRRNRKAYFEREFDFIPKRRKKYIYIFIVTLPHFCCIYFLRFVCCLWSGRQLPPTKWNQIKVYYCQFGWTFLCRFVSVGCVRHRMCASVWWECDAWFEWNRRQFSGEMTREICLAPMSREVLHLTEILDKKEKPFSERQDKRSHSAKPKAKHF